MREYDRDDGSVRHSPRLASRNAADSRRASGPEDRRRIMPSQKLVRCLIRPARSTMPPSARYVPLEIYGLWEFMMRQKHGFEVTEARASLWLDMEDSPEAAYGEEQYERVTEVTAFVYSGRDEMFTRACRYFPSSDCDRLKQIFLTHYRENGDRIQPQVRQPDGIWLHREPRPVPV